MKIDELKKLEMQIGFTVGIFIGAAAAWVLILFFTDWQWYFKLFSSIGSLGILGSLLLALNDIVIMRRNYMETMAEMKKVNEESNKVIEEKVENEPAI